MHSSYLNATFAHPTILERQIILIRKYNNIIYDTPLMNIPEYLMLMVDSMHMTLYRFFVNYYASKTSVIDALSFTRVVTHFSVDSVNNALWLNIRV